MYPIPKPTNWNYNLTQTKPILLIECLQKCFMKLLTKRTGIILAKHNIFKDPNYAGLPGESITAPLTIINATMEDARDHKDKPLWIIAQDMAKVFDSVGMEPLKFAMQRIKLPHQFIDLIIDTFNDRQIAIITHYGITNTFIAQDGSDQGEAISPLL